MSGSGLVAFAGGIGLFLLGMKLMSDGLKVAAGEALRRILSQWTSSLARGVVSGVLVTALVQSSSAVIFAVIGFVNAGLLTLTQAVGVIYGANVGTTITSWLVALVGFKFDIKALALPAIAAGMLLRVFSAGRVSALGEALAGFGVFFLGIDVLKSVFDDAGAAVPLDSIPEHGFIGRLLFALLGVGLTVAMQSSSAALAVTLTAAAGGLVSLPAAAAVAIGANIGTTSTGLLAVIGATPAAKRAASAHVLFNGVSGVAALAVLPWLLGAAQAGASATGLGEEPATVIAVFHTLANLLGLALMLPLAKPVTRRLERMFRNADEDESRPRHLDDNVLAMPALALDAARLELCRVEELVRRMGVRSLAGDAAAASLTVNREGIERLTLAVADFAVRAQRGELPADQMRALQQALRAAQYLLDAAQRWTDVATMRERGGFIAGMTEARARARGMLDREGHDDRWRGDAAGFGDAYDEAKSSILDAAATGRIAVTDMIGALDELAGIRAAIERIDKAARCIDLMREKSLVADGDAILPAGRER